MRFWDEWHTLAVGPPADGSYTHCMSRFIHHPHRSAFSPLLTRAVTASVLATPPCTARRKPENKTTRMLNIPVWGGFRAVLRHIQRENVLNAAPWRPALARTVARRLSVETAHRAGNVPRDVLQHSRSWRVVREHSARTTCRDGDPANRYAQTLTGSKRGIRAARQAGINPTVSRVARRRV